jgi:hypothetical protein
MLLAQNEGEILATVRRRVGRQRRGGRVTCPAADKDRGARESDAGQEEGLT